MVRRVDRQVEVLIWCKETLGCARQRMGQKILNCCEPVHVGTKEHGKMLKRIQILEDGRVPAKEAQIWRIEVKKRRITWKEYSRLLNEFELKGGVEESCKRERLQDRGALPREEGDVIREYSAMHEENFLSSWLREDLFGKEEGRKKEDKKIREEVKRMGKVQRRRKEKGRKKRTKR